MSFLRETKDGVEIHIRATPNAKADQIDGAEVRDDGKTYLKIRTRAIADDNKANIAIIKIIAKILRITKNEIELTFGHKGRTKALLVKSKNLDIGMIENILLNSNGKL